MKLEYFTTHNSQLDIYKPNRYEIDVGLHEKGQKPEALDRAYSALQAIELWQRAAYFIENDIFMHSPSEFHSSFIQTSHPLMLTSYSVNEFSGMKTYKTPEFNIGFALKDHSDCCEIVAVHNNEKLINNIGHLIVQAAIRHGGNSLNHFGSDKLNSLYGSLNFKEVHRELFNPQYDPEGLFELTYGQLPVIYRVLTTQ
ncbi:MAG: hypothetical protein Q8P72_04465 [Candidatus Roizmanbacteria bacterium]|nr:hypothetical protein [Candidatus Roizmanbacteria bacterium]